MSLLENMILQEKQRIAFIIARYEKQLKELPKGSLVEKKVNNNNYYYLQYREGKKVVSSYIGKDENKINETRSRIEKRKHIESMLKFWYGEYSLAKKVTEAE